MKGWGSGRAHPASGTPKQLRHDRHSSLQADDCDQQLLALQPNDILSDALTQPVGIPKRISAAG
jgi:hypothetical protein